MESQDSLAARWRGTDVGSGIVRLGIGAELHALAACHATVKERGSTEVGLFAQVTGYLRLLHLGGPLHALGKGLRGESLIVDACYPVVDKRKVFHHK